MKRNFEIGRQPANTKLGERRVHTVRCRGGFIKYRALKLDHGNYCWPGEAVTKKTRILGVVYNATSNELVRTNTLVKGSIVQIDATPFKNWYKRHYGVLIGKAKQAAHKRPVKGADKTKTKKQKVDEKKETKKPESKKETKVEPKKAEPKKAETKKAETKKAEPKKAETKKPVTEAKKGDTKQAEKKQAEKKPAAGKKEEKKSAKKDMQVEGKTTTKRPPINKKGKIIKKRKRPTSNTMLRKWRLRNKSRVLEATLADQFTKGRLYAKIASRPGQVGHADGYILEGEELAFYVKKMNLKKKK